MFEFTYKTLYNYEKFRGSHTMKISDLDYFFNKKENSYSNSFDNFNLMSKDNESKKDIKPKNQVQYKDLIKTISAKKIDINKLKNQVNIFDIKDLRYVSSFSDKDIVLLALKTKDNDIINTIIDSKKFPLDKSTDKNRMSRSNKKDYPTLYAIKTRNYNLLDKLLKSGANPNLMVHTYPGFSLLHHASLKSDNEAIRILLENGADIDRTDFVKNTALINATKTDTIKYLISKGANVNHRNTYGETVLHKIMCLKNKEIFDYVFPLINDYSIRTNDSDGDKKTYIHHAIDYGFHYAIKPFIKNNSISDTEQLSNYFKDSLKYMMTEPNKASSPSLISALIKAGKTISYNKLEIMDNQSIIEMIEQTKFERNIYTFFKHSDIMGLTDINLFNIFKSLMKNRHSYKAIELIKATNQRFISDDKLLSMSIGHSDLCTYLLKNKEYNLFKNNSKLDKSITTKIPYYIFINTYSNEYHKEKSVSDMINAMIQQNSFKEITETILEDTKSVFNLNDFISIIKQLHSIKNEDYPISDKEVDAIYNKAFRNELNCKNAILALNAKKKIQESLSLNNNKSISVKSKRI